MHNITCHTQLVDNIAVVGVVCVVWYAMWNFKTYCSGYYGNSKHILGTYNVGSRYTRTHTILCKSQPVNLHLQMMITGPASTLPSCHTPFFRETIATTISTGLLNINEDEALNLQTENGLIYAPNKSKVYRYMRSPTSTSTTKKAISLSGRKFEKYPSQSNCFYTIKNAPNQNRTTDKHTKIKLVTVQTIHRCVSNCLESFSGFERCSFLDVAMPQDVLGDFFS